MNKYRTLRAHLPQETPRTQRVRREESPKLNQYSRVKFIDRGRLQAYKGHEFMSFATHHIHGHYHGHHRPNGSVFPVVIRE